MSHIETEEGVQIMIQECEYVGNTGQAISSDLHNLQPMDMEEESTEIYLLGSGQHYSVNTSAITHDQMESDLMHGTTTDQLLAKEDGAYITQQDVDLNKVHTITATHSVTADTSMPDAEWYLQNFELPPKQMKSDLTHGTITDQLLAKDSGAYIKQQDVDPNTVHTITATHSVTANTSLPIDEWLFQNFDFSPNQMESDVMHGTTTDQLHAKESGAYIKQQVVDPNTIHTITATHSVTANTLLTPDGWLLQNFELASDMSLPRSTVYKLYLHHCNEDKLKPLIPQLLGKIISRVFPQLKTRRFGKRGNSKYHYYGIRLIPGSAASKLAEENDLVDWQQKPQRGHKFQSRSGGGTGILKMGNKYEQNANSSVSLCHSNSLQHDPHEHLYPGDLPEAIPNFPDIEFPVDLPEDCTLEDLDTFRCIYIEHCAAFVNSVVNLKFNTVESLWREFWQSQDNNNGDECDKEKYLPKRKLYLLCKCGPVQQFVWRVDCQFHQIAVDILIPNILVPIPSSVIQSIQNFANGLESCLKRAMTNCPEEMVHIKVSAMSVLAQTLWRYSSLNHLAQAVHHVLQNYSLRHQMLVDLNQVDFCKIQAQASWVCQCDDSMVQLEVVFKKILHEQNSLEQWSAWLEGVISQVLKPYEGTPNFAKAARQFLLKWSFYSSLVIRDISLRSAASFGSLHVIHLLYDKYIFFIIEHKVALETGNTPIGVMGETCSSLVIRDLSLRSAANFGSLHEIRLLYDEYTSIFFIIEHKVALEMGDTPIAVVGETYSSLVIRDLSLRSAANFGSLHEI
ncbi:DNA-binding protein RFX2, partial [Cryptotermes secundus]|uniref:DNA-binding protein RFX2 n=1 Tax=Cryptotermes secundus TaxID=105785 RepID=UPI001454D799